MRLMQEMPFQRVGFLSPLKSPRRPMWGKTGTLPTRLADPPQIWQARLTPTPRIRRRLDAIGGSLVIWRLCEAAEPSLFQLSFQPVPTYFQRSFDTAPLDRNRHLARQHRPRAYKIAPSHSKSCRNTRTFAVGGSSTRRRPRSLARRSAAFRVLFC